MPIEWLVATASQSRIWLKLWFPLSQYATACDNKIMLMKQLLCALWAYVSCHVFLCAITRKEPSKIASIVLRPCSYSSFSGPRIVVLALCLRTIQKFTEQKAESFLFAKGVFFRILWGRRVIWSILFLWEKFLCMSVLFCVLEITVLQSSVNPERKKSFSTLPRERRTTHILQTFMHSDRDARHDTSLWCQWGSHC